MTAGEDNAKAVQESGKAIQETAKVAGKLIDGLGPWLSKLIGEPTAELGRMITDRLRYLRAVGALRLHDKYERELLRRGIITFKPVAAPLALPAIEHGSLENDDSMQQLWANLLASASDADFGGETRTAFVGIIAELAPLDADVLKRIYDFDEAKKSALMLGIFYQHRDGLYRALREQHLSLTVQALDVAIDNLLRTRCLTEVQRAAVAYPAESDLPPRAREMLPAGGPLLDLTPLGRAFVLACITPPMHEKSVRVSP